jgi:proteasome lid subunit RPN8/RPN11
MIDVEQSKNFMLTHAKAMYPNECCGVIIRKGEKQEVICGRNVSDRPRHNFVLHPEDYGYAEDNGDVLAVYHSHCEGSPQATTADMTTAETHELAIITISLCKDGDTFHDTWSIYKPTGWKADLIGRPFVYGVMDCYSLVRDYYLEKLGIKLPLISYTPNWAHTGSDLYTMNLPKNDFVQVSPPLQEHDLILMQLRARVPNHIAIYIGDGLMLHHPQAHLSGLHPYICEQGYYAKNTVGFYRHKSLLKPTVKEMEVMVL